MKKSRPKPFVLRHKDGSLWARGQTVDGAPVGYWEWFRKNGVRMRSGAFSEGEPVGEWTTYDKTGAAYKVTNIKTKKKPKKKV